MAAIFSSESVTTPSPAAPSAASPAVAGPMVARPGTSSAVRDLLAQAARPGMISLAGGLPDASLFPVDELAAIAAALLAADGARLLQYSRTEGLDDAREVLSEHFALGDPERVLVTTGSQQALDLLVRVLIEPGDAVVVADPEYLGLLQVLSSHGARPVPVRVDADGLDVAALADELAAGLRPKACYLVPHFHNPTGATLAADRRAELHRLSSHYGFVVIEDDPYRDLHHPDDPAPVDVGPELADPAWTVRLRSASKSLAPGLRVALAHAPTSIHEAMTIAKQSADLHTATLNQAIVCHALQASWFPAHLDGLRHAYQHKRHTLIEALRTTFGDRIRLHPPSGGMFVWVDFGGLDTSVDTARWLERALDDGVCFVPGAAFAVDADLRSFARLSYATASEAELLAAVERLARSLPA